MKVLVLFFIGISLASCVPIESTEIQLTRVLVSILEAVVALLTQSWVDYISVLSMFGKREINPRIVEQLNEL